MCLRCVRFVWPKRFRTEAELYALVERVRSFVSNGILKVVQASSPIEKIREGFPSGDTCVLVFQCAKCGREFQLIADMYHGWGRWR